VGNESGERALVAVVKPSTSKVIRLLLDSGVAVKEGDGEFSCELFAAVRRGNIDIVKMLLPGFWGECKRRREKPPS